MEFKITNQNANHLSYPVIYSYTNDGQYVEAKWDDKRKAFVFPKPL